MKSNIAKKTLHVRSSPIIFRLDTERRVDRRAVESRLVAILKAFSALNGPQQLFKHKLMFQIFVCLLGHQEATVGQLALSCVLRFKPRYLMPYGEVTRKLFIKGKLRDAMLQLKDCAQNDALDQEHRSDFFPLLARTLMGRLSSRAGSTTKKDSPSARRIAIFSFVAAICKKDDEIYPFVYLTLRRYIPPNTPTKAIEAHDENDRAAFLAQLESLTASDCCRLPTPVHEGFLNVLDAIISQLGHRVLRFVPSFMDIILSLLEVYEVKELMKMEDNEAIEDELDGQGPLLRAGAVRGLCYRRLTALFERFPEVFEFAPYANRIWSCLDRALVGLPEAAANSDKAPSLLLLLRTLSSNTKLITLLAQNDLAVASVLKCLSGTSCESVNNATLAFIDNLLPKDSTNDDSLQKVEGEFNGAALMKKHIDVLLRQFRISLGSRASVNNWRRELNLLCRTSVLVMGTEDDAEAVRIEELESLCSLLFPFLDLGQRISDQDRLTVLGILQSMIPRLPSDVARTYYSSSAPALGPSRGRTGITSKKVRGSIASVFCLISQHHYTDAKHVTDIVRRLCAVHSKRIDEYDYDAIISALAALTASSDGESSWLSLVQTHGWGGSVVLSPVIHSCFNFVYEDDGVVARSAVKALKVLIALAAQKAGFNVYETKVDGPESETDEWKRLLEGTLMPLIRSGLSSRDDSYRRFFVQLLSEAVGACRTSGSPNLYGDLSCLIHDEEQDLDFFMNFTHVQIHRRTRALRRLRKHVSSDTDSIGLQSISNILLPLALHPVYESKTKLEEPFALEAIATIGALARLLSWSKYNNILWTTLTQFHRHPEQERYIIGVLCSIIDAFHFDVAMSDAEEENAEKSSVLRALENRIIPKVEDLLVKEKVARGGTKMRVLRPAVVLALVKVRVDFSVCLLYSVLIVP
jgi:U3 small nucleolar RNA-associated protein 20